MRATRQMENMGPVGNTARRIFHSGGVRDIEAGLASTGCSQPASGRDGKANDETEQVYEGKSPRARRAEALRGSRATERMGLERKKVKFWEID